MNMEAKKKPHLKIYRDDSDGTMMQIAIITIVNKVLICRLSFDDWQGIKNGDKPAYNELVEFIRNAWITTEACFPNLMNVDYQSDDVESDDEHEFQQCAKCDGHDACADFGCAYEAGLGHLVQNDLPF